MKKIVFYAIVFFPSCIFSQVYSPGYKVSYTVTNDSNQALNNYQVLVVLNTAQPISSGHMKPDGSDIRFSPDSCTPGAFYDYWIEQSINTSSTRIWVKVPALAANASTDFLMWYGDPAANAQSNFNNTFPLTYISNGHDTSFSGIIQYDWFQLDSGDLISLSTNVPLEIRSRVMKINGNINGNGLGHMAPATIANGNGPGAGSLSSNAGAGGGSYGGIGGTGGYDLGDSPGVGGPVYGSASDLTCLLGSSGGTTDNAPGGNGGGAIQLTADCIYIKGRIQANGAAGAGSIGRCGGGGSGGTILVYGENIDIDTAAHLTVSGGNGGNGASAANDGGGGGAGGRIKIHHGTNFMYTGHFMTSGGTGGLYGSQAYGAAGSAGSFFDSTGVNALAHITHAGIEMALQAQIIGLDSVYCLNKDTVHLYAVPPGGTFSGAGVVADYFYPLNAGVGTHPISYMYTDPNGCGTLYDTVFVLVLNIPTYPSASNNGPLCEGDILMLGSSDSLAIHHWAGPNGFVSSAQSPVINHVSQVNNGNYAVTITNISGCSSTVVTNVVVYSAPDASVSNNGPVCVDGDLVFDASGGLSYNWNGPNGFTSGVQSPTVNHTQFIAQGTYTVTVVGSSGCSTTITTDVQVNGCYNGVEDAQKKAVSVYPNPATDAVWIESIQDNFNDHVALCLIDISGKKVLQKTINTGIENRLQVDLHSMAAGVYILTLTDGSTSKSFKIVKQ